MKCPGPLSVVSLVALIALATACSTPGGQEREVHYTYDPDGNVTSSTGPDGTTTKYKYDAKGRWVSTQYPDDTRVSVEYNGVDQVTGVKDSLGTSAREYDVHGRLKSVTDALGHTLHYEYESRGLLKSLTYPNGDRVQYDWDGDRNLVAMHDWTGSTRWQYDLSGRVTQRELPNGITTTYRYNSAFLPIQITHVDPTGSPLGSIAYEYGNQADGYQITRSTALPHQPVQKTGYRFHEGFRFSNLSRANGEEIDFQYGPGGRFQSLQSSFQGTAELHHEGDLLTRIEAPKGTAHLHYDTKGNLVEFVEFDGTSTHPSWDSEGRLTQIEGPDSFAVFSHDGVGRLLRVTDSETSTEFVSDPGSSFSIPLAEIRADGTLHHFESIGLSRSTDPDLSDPVVGAMGLLPSPEIIETVFPESNRQLKPKLLESIERLPGTAPMISPRALVAIERSRANLVDLPAVAPTLPDGPPVAVERIDPPSQNEFQVPAVLQLGGQFARGVGRDVAMSWLEQRLQNMAQTPLAGYGPRRVVGRFGYGLVHYGLRLGEGLQAGYSAGEAIQQGKYEVGAVRAMRPIALALTRALTMSPNPVLVGVGYAGVVIVDMGFDVLETRAHLPYHRRLRTDLRARGIQKLLDQGKRRADLRAFLATTGIANPEEYLDENWRSLGLLPRTVPPFTNLPGGPCPGPGCDGPGPPGGGAIGGVWLGQVAEVLADLGDLEGASYDPASGELTLLGREEVTAPPLDPRALSVALTTLLMGQEPSVSIEPCQPGVDDGCMKVHYNGRFQLPDDPAGQWYRYGNSNSLIPAQPPTIFGTHFGTVLFRADHYLKSLSLGRQLHDPSRKLQPAVPGYASILDRLAGTPASDRGLSDDRCLIRSPADLSRPSDCYRLWFVPGEMVLELSSDKRRLKFPNANILTEARFVRFKPNGAMEDVPGDDPAVQNFVEHLNDHYSDFARAQPELAELNQLAKVVALARWLYDTRVPVDPGWLRDVSPHPDVETPTVTEAVEVVQGDVGLYGGVEFPAKNEYTETPVEGDLMEVAHSDRDSRAQTSWKVERRGKSFEAATLHLEPAEILGGYTTQRQDIHFWTAGGTRVSFARRYSSTDLRPHVLGRGWAPVLPTLYLQQTPAEDLTSKEPPERYSVHSHMVWQDGLTRRKLFRMSDGLFRSASSDSAIELAGITDTDPYVPLSVSSLSLDPALPRQPIRLRNRNGERVRFSGFAVRFRDGTVQAFDRFGRLGGERDPEGHEVTYTYSNGAGHPVASAHLESITGPNGQGLSFTADAAGRISRIEGSDGRTAAYAYSAEGHLIEFSRGTAEGETHLIERYSYDEEGRLVTIEDAFGRLLLGNDYDALGRLRATSGPGTSPTSVRYEDEDRRVVYTAPGGGRFERRFDRENRLISLQRPDGSEIRFSYDDAGRLTRQVDTRGHGTSFEYDEAGNLSAVVNPLGDSTRLLNYGAHGRPEVLVAPEDHMVFFTYDSEGRLTGVESGAVLKELSEESLHYEAVEPRSTAFVYDEEDRLMAVEDEAGFTRRFFYDALGRPAGEESPRGGRLSWELDQEGGIRKIRAPEGFELEYEYDEKGRLSGLHSPVGSVSYEYAQGRLRSVNDEWDGTTRLEYDDAGRLSGVTEPSGGVTSLEYDDAGRVREIVEPTGKTRRYTYDAMGRVTSVKWSFQPSGGETSGYAMLGFFALLGPLFALLHVRRNARHRFGRNGPQ